MYLMAHDFFIFNIDNLWVFLIYFYDQEPLTVILWIDDLYVYKFSNFLFYNEYFFKTNCSTCTPLLEQFLFTQFYLPKISIFSIQIPYIVYNYY